MLIYGNYSITAEKTITGGSQNSWCEYSPEVTCGLHPHHISGVAIDSAFIKNFCYFSSLDYLKTIVKLLFLGENAARYYPGENAATFNWRKCHQQNALAFSPDTVLNQGWSS